jgi:hypothetical protein
MRKASCFVRINFFITEKKKMNEISQETLNLAIFKIIKKNDNEGVRLRERVRE